MSHRLALAATTNAPLAERVSSRRQLQVMTPSEAYCVLAVGSGRGLLDSLRHRSAARRCAALVDIRTSGSIVCHFSTKYYSWRSWACLPQRPAISSSRR